MLDRGFFSVDAMSVLKESKIKFLMPCTNTKGVVEALDEYAKDNRDQISKHVITNEAGPPCLV